jgi:hypothetical protein
MAGSDEEEDRVEKLGADAEREARSLEKDADELGEQIDDTRGEWMRKRRDGSVPGAPPPDEDGSEAEAEDGEGAPA